LLLFVLRSPKGNSVRIKLWLRMLFTAALFWWSGFSPW